MNYLWSWLLIGLVGYAVGTVSDFLLYGESVKEKKIDICILMLGLVLGPLIWLLVISSIIEYAKRKKKHNAK